MNTFFGGAVFIFLLFKSNKLLDLSPLPSITEHLGILEMFLHLKEILFDCKKHICTRLSGSQLPEWIGILKMVGINDEALIVFIFHLL